MKKESKNSRYILSSSQRKTPDNEKNLDLTSFKYISSAFNHIQYRSLRIR